MTVDLIQFTLMKSIVYAIYIEEVVKEKTFGVKLHVSPWKYRFHHTIVSFEHRDLPSTPQITISSVRGQIALYQNKKSVTPSWL